MVECGLSVNDIVNDFIEKAQNADGFIFGSPVYFSGMNGSLMSFMDRVFFAGPKHKDGNPFAFKPAAAVVSARRAGTTSALDQMNKYFLHGQLPVISSRYWNMVHGNTPEEVLQDEEGLQVMRQLGRNMAWFLKLKEVPTSFKCKDGYGKMLELYGKARRVYKKGYETRELINTLDMSVIRKKRNCALIPLEMALGVVPEQAVNR